MNISKKALMSFLMALTSLVAMAQPYYHVMKRDGNKLIEEVAMYDAKNYKIKVDMNKPRPKDAIGGEITIEGYNCDYSPLKRSFYFTKHGNVYYNNSEGKFYFEKSQLDYPTGKYSKDHCGHFYWGKTIEGCIDLYYKELNTNATETDFYFANPANLPKLKEDLGNEEWAVLSACEWRYINNKFGEYGWEVDGEPCLLIDTTPGKSLLRAIESINGGKTMSKEEFDYYETQGLVCLPASGYRDVTGFPGRGYSGYYTSCTPSDIFRLNNGDPVGLHFMWFTPKHADGTAVGAYRDTGMAVRLVVLAD